MRSSKKRKTLLLIIMAVMTMITMQLRVAEKEWQLRVSFTHHMSVRFAVSEILCVFVCMCVCGRHGKADMGRQMWVLRYHYWEIRI